MLEQKHLTARDQYAPQLAQAKHQIGYRAEHAGGNHDVKARIGKRQRLHIGLAQIHVNAVARRMHPSLIQHPRRKVNRRDDHPTWVVGHAFAGAHANLQHTWAADTLPERRTTWAHHTLTAPRQPIVAVGAPIIAGTGCGCNARIDCVHRTPSFPPSYLSTISVA
jgi:hypothetical protein